MIKSIKAFFQQHLDLQHCDSEESRLKSYELAGAALMMELMQTDHELDERESTEFRAVLEKTFHLKHSEFEEVIELAREEAIKATSLYEFTRLINDNYKYTDKVKLIENMWRLAFADEKLDKYEEALIRRVTDLIYVRHSDFLKTKLRVRSKAD